MRRSLLSRFLPILALAAMFGPDSSADPLRGYDTVQILTAAGLSMCDGGILFAIDNPDPHAAITVLLADRSDPVDRIRESGVTSGDVLLFWRGIDYRGWEFLRYAANNLRGCKPCQVNEAGHPQTWPGVGNLGRMDAREHMERHTVRAASYLRDWLESPPPEVLRALAELARVGPAAFDAARFYAEDACRHPPGTLGS